jgi:hypothetical protein
LKHTKNKNIRDLYRDITEYKKGYQPRNNLVKYVTGDIHAGSHSIFNNRKNYICQLLNVHDVNGIRQRKMHISDPLDLEASSLEAEVVIDKLKRYVTR